MCENRELKRREGDVPKLV